MSSIEIPYNFTPRGYQLPFLRAMDSGKKRAILVWHRRSGKDKVCLNYMIRKMYERVGGYYYFFPTAAMGRDILWDGIDRDGYRYMDHFPQSEIRSIDKQEMNITLKMGSVFKIRGTDKREPIGINPVGAIFSEMSRQVPDFGWDLVRPILSENGGWAVFNGTSRGMNHFYELYKRSLTNPNWFSEVLTVDDTGSVSESAIQEDRDSGMPEDLIRQEYWCDFAAGAVGSYYARLIAKAHSAGRIIANIYDPLSDVHTAWDLGYNDETSIWFYQEVGKEVRVIDHYFARGEDIGFFADKLKQKSSERGFSYGCHFVPHDAAQHNLGTGETLITLAAKKGLKLTVLPQEKRKQIGIERTKALLKSCWFDSEYCQAGLKSLENHRKEYNFKKKCYMDTPLHDWTSDDSDAFRMLSMAVTGGRSRDSKTVSAARTSWRERKLQHA